MKNVKFILPAVAFLFAIVASFATVNAKTTAFTTKPGSYISVSNCAFVHNCTVQGSEACEDLDGVELREFKASNDCQTPILGIWE